ncbi:hypothetical protein F5Y18DRAFT_379068 [Xylariaceae sp. FL1019]|nr:hypothetical protein F5Y18DRAFT_379068 [Xylariaceae sp. FL1019]
MASPPTLTSEPRLVVTGHNDDGTSVFAADHTITPFAPFGPQGSTFVNLDLRSSIPVSNQDAVNQAGGTIPRAPPGGLNFCIANYPPGCVVPMHRTLSLDWIVVLSGEIVLALDNGEEKTVRAGEFIVQAGTNHQWFNRTSEVCQMAFVLLDAKKVSLGDGTQLDATVMKLGKD